MAIIPNVIQKVVTHAHFLCRVNSSCHSPGAPGHSAESHRLRAQASHRPPVPRQLSVMTDSAAST